MLPHLFYTMSICVSFHPIPNHFILSPLFLTFCLFFFYRFLVDLYPSFCQLMFLSFCTCSLQSVFVFTTKIPPSIFYHVNPSGSFSLSSTPHFLIFVFYLPIFGSSTLRLSCLVLSASECRGLYWQIQCGCFCGIHLPHSHSILSPVALGFLFL